MSRVIALAAHTVLALVVLIGALLGSTQGSAPLWQRVAVFLLLLGSVGTLVVLWRRESKGRVTFLIFNILLLAFALVELCGLLWYQLRYGDQPLFWGLVTISLVLVPSLAAVSALKRRFTVVASEHNA